MSTGVPDGISVDDFFLEFRLLCCISALSGSKEMYDFVVSKTIYSSYVKTFMSNLAGITVDYFEQY